MNTSSAQNVKACSVTYLTTLLVTQTVQHRMMGWHLIMNWKGCGRKRTWCSLTQCRFVFAWADWLTRTRQSISPTRLEPGTLPIKGRQVTAWLTFTLIFNIDAGWRYSRMCALILWNTKIGSTFLNHSLRFPKKKSRFWVGSQTSPACASYNRRGCW